MLFSLFITSDHKWVLLFTQFIVFIFSIFILKKNNKLKNLIFLILPFLVLFVVALLINFKEHYIRGIPYLIFIPVITYLLYIAFSKKSIIITSLILIIIPFNSFIIFPNWFIFCIENERDNFLINKEFPIINGISNKDKIPINLNNKDEILVLDFWTTSCGTCFKKFPDFQKLKETFNDHPNIKFYSINVPIQRDTFYKTVSLVTKLNYNFKTFYANNKKEIETKLNFNMYPQVFVIKNNTVKYAGGMHYGKNVFIYNLEKIINENINN